MPFTPPSRPVPHRARVPWALLCVLLSLWALAKAAPAAEPASTPRFAAPAQMAALRLGPEVLTPQERAFVAGLPEVRVAIPLPAVQPYEVVSVDGVVSGIHPEMLGYLARAFGLRVRPVLLPSFADALQALEKGDADLMLTLGYTAQRTRYLEYTLGVTPLPGALFARTGVRAPPAGTGPPLERARFAVERDFIVGDFLRRQYPEAQLVPVETTGQALQAVHEGRADYYLGALLTTMDWLSRQPELGLEVTRLLNYSSGYYHFAVRKDWAPLAQILNRGISTLRASNQATLGADTALRAALASAPAGMPQAAPLSLRPAELQTLVDKPVWRVGAVRGLPLLNHVEPDGQHTGIAAEVTEQVAHRIGIGVHVQPFDNVGEMIEALRRGHIDLIPFFTRTPEREAEFAYSRPYVEMPYVIVARTDAPLYYDLHSLRGKRLALPLCTRCGRCWPNATARFGSSMCPTATAPWTPSPMAAPTPRWRSSCLPTCASRARATTGCARWPRWKRSRRSSTLPACRLHGPCWPWSTAPCRTSRRPRACACAGAGWRWTWRRCSRGGGTCR
jgi:two-component system sensor histidine kinase EvgS